MSFSIFLSLVFVTRNQPESIKKLLLGLTTSISSLVKDYEIILVDNNSDIDVMNLYKTIIDDHNIPNVQIYALSKQVNKDTASWAGVENSLGDFVVIIDPSIDDINILPKMLESAINGKDIVFGENKSLYNKKGYFYSAASKIFYWFFSQFSNENMRLDIPRYRILSKRAVQFILQHNHPALTYRHLPFSRALSRSIINYSHAPSQSIKHSFQDRLDNVIELLMSNTRTPMRIVTFLSLFGAISNIVYSFYVLIIGFFKSDIAPGWISLSLQQSGMFFLISLVLLILGEYILHMVSLTNEGPSYHIGQEFTSRHLTTRRKLNIEEIVTMDEISRRTN